MSPFLLVDRRGVEPRSPGCKPSVFPLDQPPINQEVSPGVEPGLRPYHGRVPPKTLTDLVSDRGWSRTIDLLVVTQASWPLDYAINQGVTEVGVEPTKSSRSQRDRFSDLRTRSNQVAGPGVAPGRSGL